MINEMRSEGVDADIRERNVLYSRRIRLKEYRSRVYWEGLAVRYISEGRVL